MRTLLPALGCMLMMVPLMFLMARGHRSSSPDADRASEVDRLRDEVAHLRSELDRDQTEAPRG